MDVGARDLKSVPANLQARKLDADLGAVDEEIEQENPRVNGLDLIAGIHEYSG